MVALDIVRLRSVHGMTRADKRAIPGFGRLRDYRSDFVAIARLPCFWLVAH